MVPPLIVLLILVSPSVEAGCSKNVPGQLVVPTGTGARPIYSSPQVSDAIYAYYVWDIVPGAYELVSVATPTRACSACPLVPDFNVAWMKEGALFDEEVFNDNTEGDSYGFSVPTGADYALVYMRYGPDSGGDGHLVTADFHLRMACT